MKQVKSLFAILLFILFLLSSARSMAQFITFPDYFGDVSGYKARYFFSPFPAHPWMSTSFFDNSFEFPNCNNSSYLSYPESYPLHSLFPGTGPTFPVSLWAGLNDSFGYSLNRYYSSTDHYDTLPVLYSNLSNFSWMFGPTCNLLNGYINFIQNKTPGNPGNQGNQGENSVSQLVNKQWKLQSFGLIGEEKPLLPDTEITIRFDEDKTYKGNAGCNEYTGTYEASNDAVLSISSPGSTDMACSYPQGIMQQEYEYLDQILGTVCSFEINQDNLKLYYDDGQKVLNFLADDHYASKLIEYWTLQSFGTTGEKKPVVPGQIVIKFVEDNTFWGFSGCSEYSGTYEASNDGTLSIFLTSLTELDYCSDFEERFPGIIEREEEYLEALQGVGSFEIYQDNVNLFRNNLKLFYDNGQKVLTFTEIESAITPKWICEYINKADFPGLFKRETYHGEIVYFEQIYRCCDAFNNLYDSAGNIICHPSGGIDGHGDGRCPDFSSEIKEGVWLGWVGPCSDAGTLEK